MDECICTVCGYTYDPAKGDPDSGVEPGTAFKDIPADWVCPVCGVTKDEFEAQQAKKIIGAYQTALAANFVCSQRNYIYHWN